MINELTILEINKEENLLNVVLHESYAIGRGAFALPPYVSTNAKRQLVTLDYLNEALASFSGGGGGTINTSNGLSGDGSVGNPAILGGQLIQDTQIDLNGFALELGFHSNRILIDDTDNQVLIQAGDGENDIQFILNPLFVQFTGLSLGSPVSLLGLDGSNNIVLGSLSGITAGNGLSIDEDTGAVFLGGNLSQDTAVQLSGFAFTLNSNNAQFRISDSDKAASIVIEDETGAGSNLTLDTTQYAISVQDADSNTTSVTFTSTAINITGINTGVAVNGLGVDADGNIVLTVL